MAQVYHEQTGYSTNYCDIIGCISVAPKKILFLYQEIDSESLFSKDRWRMALSLRLKMWSNI